MKASTIGLAVLLVVGTAGCTSPEAEPASEADSSGDPVATLDEPAPVPDTTAQGMWSYLQRVDYPTRWARWPETSPFYTGTEPHGLLLNTWVNETARSGVAGGSGPEPGSIIVKQNHAPDSTLLSVTVMYKVEGYAPEAGDWWWMKRLADGDVQASGRVSGCRECHTEGRDYLMTDRPES